MNIPFLCTLLIALLLPQDHLGGTWQGRLTSAAMSGSVELSFRQDGARLAGDALFRSGPNEVRSPLADITCDGATLRFSATIEGALCLFEGRLDGDVVAGSFRVIENGATFDHGEWSAARGEARAAEPATPEDARLRAGETQELVAAIANVLRRMYVDAARGEALALAIEARQAQGGYARIADARVLADLLGRDLYEVAGDSHLKISFSSEPPAPETPDTPETPQDREELHSALRTTNFGFRRVEILDGNVGLLDLSRFVRADLGGETASLALGFLQNCDALVIDLRACGGGDPAMVAFLASWLFEGPPTHVADMYRREDDLTVQWWTAAWVPHRRLGQVPVRVLTAARTLSAAEALAFHLQQLGRAQVGERSGGGAAHPSRRVRATDRFAIMVPTSRTFDPETKTDWEGTGVRPDIDVPEGDALRAAHLDLLLTLARAEPDPARAAELREIAESVKRAP